MNLFCTSELINYIFFLSPFFSFLSVFSTEGRWFWVGFTKRNPRSDGAWEWSDGTPVKIHRKRETDQSWENNKQSHVSCALDMFEYIISM